MQALSSLFACCNKENQEPQVTLYLKPRPSSSLDTRTARIQRSLPRHQQRASSARPSSSLTISTNSHRLGPSNNTKTQREYCYSKCHIPQKHTPGIKENEVQQHQVSEGTALQEQTLLNQIHPLRTPQTLMTDFLQQRNLDAEVETARPYAPRLLMDRRVRKARAQEAMQAPKEEIKRVIQPPSKRMPLVASILQTIDERLSMPSCSESQFNDINRIPSRSVIGNNNEPLDRIGELSPKKNISCTINSSNLSHADLFIAQSLTIKRSAEEKTQQIESRVLTENTILYQQNREGKTQHRKANTLGELRSRFW